MKRLKVFIILISLTQLVFASGEKFQITIMLTPSYENMNYRKFPNLFDYKLSYNLGLEYKHFLAPDVSVSTGILLQNKGFRTQPVYADPAIAPSGNIYISARYLSVPLNLDGHIKLSETLDFIMSGGITGGYLLSDSFIGRRLHGDAELKEGLFYTDSPDRVALNIFNQYYWGINLGMGFCKYIKAKMVICVEPYYRRQLNSAIDKNANVSGAVNPRLDSFSIDFKIGYYFNKNIRNYRKNF